MSPSRARIMLCASW